MSRQDKRRPRRQVTQWQPGSTDEYRIQLEQVGHEAWRLTVHDGIEVSSVEDFKNPDAAQQRYIDVQHEYLAVLAQFTLAPLPIKPSAILVVVDENDIDG